MYARLPWRALLASWRRCEDGRVAPHLKYCSLFSRDIEDVCIPHLDAVATVFAVLF